MVLEGIVQTITYYNPDNGYSVIKVKGESYPKPVTVIGNFPRFSPGERLELEGEWVVHPQYGQQFKCQNSRILAPENAAHMEQYLSSGILKGVGPAQAKILVDAFGDSTFEVLDKNPEQLKKVSNLSPKKRENILSQWREKKVFRDVVYFLQSHQVSVPLSLRLFQKYGGDTLTKLKSNPYELADEMWGIGFIKADTIARKMGFEDDSYPRIRAGILFALSRSSEEGHVYLEREELLGKAGEILQVEESLLVYSLDQLQQDAAIRKVDDRFYQPYLYHSELGVARCLIQLMSGSYRTLEPNEIEKGILSAEKKYSVKSGKPFTYLEKQKEAIRGSFKNGVLLVTGGPGTGKTTALLGLLEVMQSAEWTVRLAAPTGRASKRMKELTGFSASTIHRLLQYEPESRKFLHNELNPLKTDALILDEVSMVDTVLMYSLLRAIQAGTRVLLIGDADQLPSVGPGKVLREIMESKIIPHVRLETIVRQRETSPIVLNAHRINQGELPEFSPSPEFRYIPGLNSTEILEEAKNLMLNSLPSQYGYHPLWDIQLLTPMNRGNLGTLSINQHIQQALFPQARGIKYKDRIFFKGDKVMQLRNNYEKNVFNGDIGVIVGLDTAKKNLSVRFDEVLQYDGEELEQLQLAYAVTIHKSQGSEFKAVILMLDMQHYLLLQRNLLYTAITRAKEKLILIGSKSALRRAVQNNPVVRRNTELGNLLRQNENTMALPF